MFFIQWALIPWVCLLRMQRLLQERDELRVVDDQLGAPTSVIALAAATVQIMEQAPGNRWSDWMRTCSGVYHMTCRGQTSWFGFAVAIAEKLKSRGIETANLIPITSAEYPTPASRPHWSVLDNRKLQQTFGVQMPDWEAALVEVQQAYL